MTWLKLALSATLVLMLNACGGGGQSDQRVAALAREIEAFLPGYLQQHGISAATVAVMKDGAVIYERAFGYQDQALTVPLRADALMTTASIVKPVTAAAIQHLASTGALRLSDKVFCPTAVNPSAANNCWIDRSWVLATDSRISDITIAHLVAHQGGWDRAGTACHAYQDNPTYQSALDNTGYPCDPMQHEFIVQARGNLVGPPSLEDDIRYFMRGGLDFTPGSSPTIGDRYSNFGYVLLGLIVERASGSPFHTFVNTALLSNLGVSGDDFKPSNSLLSQADPREPHYITTMTGPSVFAPGTTVSARDGILNAVNFQAAATTLTTARAMAVFAANFVIDTDANGIDGPDNGRRLAGASRDGFHYGDLPGTAAVVRQLNSGVSYAVLMNKNDKFEGGCIRDYPRSVRTGIDDAIAAAGYVSSRRATTPAARADVQRLKVC